MNRLFFYRQLGQWLREIQEQIDGEAVERPVDQRAICQVCQRRKGRVEQRWLQEVAEGDACFSQDDGRGNSYLMWSMGEGGRTGYGDDQKSGERDARDILVMRAIDDHDRI